MRHSPRLAGCLLAVVVATPALLGMGGFGGGREEGQPARDFSATFTDVDGTRMTVTRVTSAGDASLEGDLGRGRLRVPFDNIARVTFQPAENDHERVRAEVTLREGEPVTLTLHGLRPLDRVPAHGREPRLLPPSPPRPAPAARRRARRPLRHPLPARRHALAGGLPDLPPAPLHLPHRHPGRGRAEGATAGARVDEPLHALPVHLLPLEPGARPPALGGTLLPGPRRLRRLPARADGDVPRLPAALRAAGRAAVLRLPVRRHLRRTRRPRVPRAALLRQAGDRRR